MFVEELGRYRFENRSVRPAVWEMVPGVHWRMNEAWWLSGGWIVPVSVRPDARQWQITCWMQF